jgi:hypothetical protein
LLHNVEMHIILIRAWVEITYVHIPKAKVVAGIFAEQHTYD